MRVLFVLLPEPAALDPLIAALPKDRGEAPAGLAVRVYPRADDGRHLLSLVRAGQDPLATRRWPGLLAAIVGGALLGGLTASTLALGFAMFGGMWELALPFGLLTGAFLGGFSAAMTGTESANDEVRALVPWVRRGEVLASVVAPPDVLRALGAMCEERGYRHALRD